VTSILVILESLSVITRLRKGNGHAEG